MALNTKAKLLARVRRLKGQVNAVERALDGDVESPDLLMLLVAIQGATHGIVAELLGLRIYGVLAVEGHAEERAAEAERLVEVVRTYLKQVR